MYTPYTSAITQKTLPATIHDERDVGREGGVGGEEGGAEVVIMVGISFIGEVGFITHRASARRQGHVGGRVRWAEGRAC